jgi:hypothetical protein
LHKVREPNRRNWRRGASAVIEIVAIAMLCCCARETELQQGQNALALGHYNTAIAHFNVADSEDPKAAALGRCVAVVDNDASPVRPLDYCREAIERGNRLPDEANERLCKDAVGADAPQLLASSIFCQNATPEARDMVAASLRKTLEDKIKGDIYWPDLPSARKELEIYRHTPGARQDLIRGWEQQTAKWKAPPGTFVIMTPPVSGPNGLVANVNAPLSEWDSLPKGYKTAEGCNAVIGRMRAAIANEQATTTAGGPYPSTMVLDAMMMGRVMAHAVCIEENDPRREME